MSLSEIYINILNHPTVDATISFIKKFKSSKSYWSVSYLILLFTIREAVAWKFGSAIKTFFETQAVDSSFPILWKFLGFVLDVGGSWELVALGIFVFVVLSRVKIAESEGTSVSVRENHLTLFLLVVVGIVFFYQNDEVKTIVEDTHSIVKESDEKLDELLERTKEKEAKIEDIKVLQNISGVIKNKNNDNLSNVKIYIEKTKEEIISKNGEYIFKDILGRKNEETHLIVSKSGCDTRDISVSLGQKRDIILNCTN